MCQFSKAFHKDSSGVGAIARSKGVAEGYHRRFYLLACTYGATLQ